MIVAAVLLAMMMFLVAVAVAMRYFFSRPIVGDMEAIQMFLLGLASFSMAYCASMHSHVRVKAVIELFPYRLRSIINLFVNLITLGFLLMVIKYSIVQGIALWERGYSTMLLKIPLFPFCFVLALGFVIFSFVIFVDIIDILANIFDSEHTD